MQRCGSIDGVIDGDLFGGGQAVFDRKTAVVDVEFERTELESPTIQIETV